MTSLFEEDLQERHTPLMMAMDSLNKKLGTQKVKLASMDIQKTWKMDQETYLTKVLYIIQESIILNSVDYDTNKELILRQYNPVFSIGLNLNYQDFCRKKETSQTYRF